MLSGAVNIDMKPHVQIGATHTVTLATDKALHEAKNIRGSMDPKQYSSNNTQDKHELYTDTKQRAWTSTSNAQPSSSARQHEKPLTEHCMTQRGFAFGLNHHAEKTVHLLPGQKLRNLTQHSNPLFQKATWHLNTCFDFLSFTDTILHECTPRPVRRDRWPACCVITDAVNPSRSSARPLRLTHLHRCNPRPLGSDRCPAR